MQEQSAHWDMAALRPPRPCTTGMGKSASDMLATKDLSTFQVTLLSPKSHVLHILCGRGPGLGRDSWLCFTTNQGTQVGSEFVLVLPSHRKPPRWTYMFEVPEGHELNDVSKDWLSLG